MAVATTAKNLLKMTSSSTNTTRITGLKDAIPPVRARFSSQMISNAELRCSLCCQREQAVEQTVGMQVLCDVMTRIWRHCNVIPITSFQISSSIFCLYSIIYLPDCSFSIDCWGHTLFTLFPNSCYVRIFRVHSIYFSIHHVTRCREL